LLGNHPSFPGNDTQLTSEAGRKEREAFFSPRQWPKHVLNIHLIYWPIFAARPTEVYLLGRQKFLDRPIFLFVNQKFFDAITYFSQINKVTMHIKF
jgi:hypothetical protein